MADSTYERLMASDELWFPEGAPTDHAHDEIVGRPLDLGHEISDSGTAYVIRTVTGANGRVNVEYTSPEDKTLA